jgi:dihydroorotase
MKADYDLVLRDAVVMTPNGRESIDIGIRGERIAALGSLGDASAEKTLRLPGLTILPGVIDTQVHFREPGFIHKEDIETGTTAALLGGVTTVFEMPNTSPPTTTAADLQDKLARAHARAYTDHAFFVGATPDNVDDLGKLERMRGCAGVKVFMGSSTGSLLVEDDATLERVLLATRRRVAVHAEHEPRLRARKRKADKEAHPRAHPDWRDWETALTATKRLLAIASKIGRCVHVLHVTTLEEMELLSRHRDMATVEVTPQHLTLCAPECYEKYGTFAQMNPPIREAKHMDALWKAVREGLVDVIGSDHAPHTIEEKKRPYPSSPSGMPGVQTLVPLMLDHVNAGRLTLERFVDLTSTGPARIYHISGKGRIAVGYDADFTVVDMNMKQRIERSWLASRCGWSPFEGKVVQGWPRVTILRGRVVMREGQIRAPIGRSVRFCDTL